MEEDLVQNMEDEDEDEFEWDAGGEEDEEDEGFWLQEEEVCVSRASPAERSGHIAVTDGSCMFVWGGYKNADAEATEFTDLYLPKNEIWIYNMETGRWRVQCSEGEVPDSMSGGCGSSVDGVLYVFGGHQARGNTNTVYRLPLRTPALRWEKMSLTGLAPTCKDKLGCWVHRNSRLVYFGGYGYTAQPGHRGTFELDENSLMGNQTGRGWNNHIHILDLETSSWSQPITKGNTPTPRAAHACATIGNRGFVFGGRYMDQRLNDLHCLDLDSWEWSEMCVPQHGPVGRSWHSLTPVSADHLFLFGGFTTDRETLSDGWLYCVSRNEWRPFDHEHTQRPRLTATNYWFSRFSPNLWSGCVQTWPSGTRSIFSTRGTFCLKPCSSSCSRGSWDTPEDNHTRTRGEPSPETVMRLV
ncbi:kelch domain-containing protein 2 isoform X3 [Rhinichthys klamathensis goyatoka]|uniref:kelch domain-containing protein 2 isoform X3 n=1 Tax=Rhinichthys klamathensis goyatoka TaxID=3034132 RepID=UPI0024B54F78|nr:kelch domain-containing protein 2 isoform X3 [Rhinichthys klamathensis goyatoka]